MLRLPVAAQGILLQQMRPATVRLAALLLALQAAIAVECPAGCECQDNANVKDAPPRTTAHQHGCVVEARCGRDKEYPRGFDSRTDCLTITNPLLAKLSTADKQAFFASLPAGLRMLDLSQSGLGFGEGLPRRAFSRFPELIFLNLEFNRLKSLPGDVFKGLEKLRVLYLTGNHWQPDEEGYKRAEILGNRLDYLEPDTFYSLKKLRVLLLHHNRLKVHGPNGLDGGLFGFQKETLRVLKMFDQAQGGEFDPLSVFPREKRCPSGVPSRGECMQLDVDGDRGDVLEDMMDEAGTTLLEEGEFARWLSGVAAAQKEEL
jgi:hypothetical protein